MRKLQRVKEPLNAQQAYIEWLCSVVDKRRRGLDPEYRELALVLHQTQFYPVVPNDDNRVRDGIRLRDEFVTHTDHDFTEYRALYENMTNCSVLEMMVALARHMNDILYEQGKDENQTARWFWIMVENLGLKLYLPEDPDAERLKEQNVAILRKFIERRYSENGRGGLFPLKNPPSDQRNEELWYQMMSWIQEKTR